MLGKHRGKDIITVFKKLSLSRSVGKKSKNDTITVASPLSVVTGNYGNRFVVPCTYSTDLNTHTHSHINQ